MQVSRNEHWFSSFDQAFFTLKLSRGECEHYANAVYKMCAVKEKLIIEKNLRSIQKITPRPEFTLAQPCKATLMSGKMCSQKANCGDYCKRHHLIK